MRLFRRKKHQLAAIAEGRVIQIDDGFFRPEKVPLLGSVENCFAPGLSQAAFDQLCDAIHPRELHLKSLRANSLQALEKMAGIRKIEINYAANIDDVSSLAKLPKLEDLWLQGLSRWQDVSNLSNAPALTSLEISGGYSKEAHLSSLRPLLSLRTLTRLKLANVRVVENDLSCLVAHSSLRHLSIGTRFPKEQVRQIATQRPDIRGAVLDQFRVEMRK